MSRTRPQWGILVLLLLAAGSARAREPSAGDLRLGGGVGPGVNLGLSGLGASSAYFLFNGHAAYSIDNQWGAVLEVGFGLGDPTLPLRIRAGGQFRAAGLDLPVQPVVVAQLSFTELFQVLGADLPVLGFRVGAGFERALTSRWGLGAQLSIDLGSTIGATPTPYGTFEALLYVTWTHNFYLSP